MLKLYGATRTRAVRVAWLLEELELPYELILVEFVPTTSKFFIQNTPTGKIPTLEDGEVVMTESGAIVEYIMECYSDGQLAPPQKTPQRAEYLQWLHFAESTAFTPIGTLVWLTQYRQDASEHPGLIEDAVTRARATMDYLAMKLGSKKHLLGDDFTAADVMMGFTLAAAASLNLLKDVPNLVAYLDRLQQRKAFRSAMQKLGANEG